MGMNFHILELLPIILFFVGFFGLITSSNIMKSIVFIMLIQTAVITFWMALGARSGSIPPIVSDVAYLENLDVIADPLPQALMLTAVIIGISVTAIIITMFNTLFRKYKTTDWKTMGKLAREFEDFS